MINILSIKCGLAFAPYLAESAARFLKAGAFASQVVRQAGSGLILRHEDEVSIRYQGRQCSLGTEDVRHYGATIAFRTEAYDVKRMPDEVVISTVGQSILLSHPQSELWLERGVVSELVRVFNGEAATPDDDTAFDLPPWLSVSSGSGRLLLSDGRTGRWVLLGADHIAELEHRLKTQANPSRPANNRMPPTLTLKGLTIHLQSAFKLAETIEDFANTGNVAGFEEITPTYSLTVGRATEGIALKDSDIRVALTAREARKWASIIRGELDRLNVRRVERGRIRTVFADVEEVRWVLQWGDEVFVPRPAAPIAEPGLTRSNSTGDLVVRETGEFLLLLNGDTGACVALNESELSYVGSP
ncbi:MAG: hypothetical protein WAU45_23650 [Blastocatellia bacterium]